MDKKKREFWSASEVFKYYIPDYNKSFVEDFDFKELEDISPYSQILDNLKKDIHQSSTQRKE